MSGTERSFNITAVINAINDFVRERDWEKYHTPKNLVTSISVEANELLENFQWEDPTFPELRKDGTKTRAISYEIADILVYMLELADSLGLDLEQVIWDKIAENKEKYPVDKCRGKADKYHAYEEGKG